MDRELIRQMIRQEIAPIMLATLNSNESEYRSTFTRFASEPPINNARSILPYGISTKAPKSTQCLTVPIAGDASHVNILGHFDQNRPSVSDGEICLYGADGQKIYFKNGGTIHQGSQSANEPVVLGNVLLAFITDLITALITDPLGFDAFALPVFIDPALREKLTQYLQKYATDPSTNVVGQKNFVERGA